MGKKGKEKREEMIKAASEIKKLREKSGEWDGVAEIRKWREVRCKVPSKYVVDASVVVKWFSKLHATSH